GPSFSKENEERTTTSIVADTLLNHSSQPIEGPTQVDRLERHKHLNATGDHWASFSARTTLPRTPASNSRSITTRAPSISTITPELPVLTDVGAGRRTTRASRIAGVFAAARARRPRRPALSSNPRRRSSDPHHASVTALYGRPSVNSRSVLPLSFHSRNRSAQIRCVSVMQPSIARSGRPEKNGAHAPDTQMKPVARSASIRSRTWAAPLKQA